MARKNLKCSEKAIRRFRSAVDADDWGLSEWGLSSPNWVKKGSYDRLKKLKDFIFSGKAENYFVLLLPG